MRAARLSILVFLWMTAGCGRVERVPAASPGSPDGTATARENVPTVHVTADTMRIVTDSLGVVTTFTLIDTTGPPPRWPSEPNECRYADARPRVRPDDPRYGERYDSAAIANGVTYRCRLRPDGPEVRLVVLGEWSIPMVVKVFSPSDAQRALQTLSLDNDQGANEGGTLLVGEDLNGDGWMDLRVHTFSGSGGQLSDVFRFNPAARRFVPDTVLPGENVRRIAGRPCAATSWKTSMSNHTSREWCWSQGQWVLTRAFRQVGVGDWQVFRTLRERRDGQLRVVRADTVSIDEPRW